MKLSTNTPLDTLLDGGIEMDVITNLYGPAGSGKTNIAITTALQCLKSKNVIYIDTEGSFSLDRFYQLGGNDDIIKKINFIEPHSWEEQHTVLQELEKKVNKNIGLIIVDSFVSLYRLKLNEKNFPLINRQLATQYSILSKISRKNKIPILVTNQVYSVGDNIELTSRTVARYWSKALIELKKLERQNHRLAVLRRHRSLPEGKEIEFVIEQEKLRPLGKLEVF